MKKFIVRVIAFLCLVFSALRSSADHQRQLFYASEAYHRPWWVLIKDLRWIRIPIMGIWEVSGDTSWNLPVEGTGIEGYSTFCAHLEEIMEERDTYYFVVVTSHGGVPWPMVSGFYR